jgi:hypothetical protein
MRLTPDEKFAIRAYAHHDPYATEMAMSAVKGPNWNRRATEDELRRMTHLRNLAFRRMRFQSLADARKRVAATIRAQERGLRAEFI